MLSRPDALSVAQSLVHAKARRLSRRNGFNRSDEADIRQQLTLHLVQRARTFDESRGPWEVFVSYILDKQCISLWRQRLAARRSPRREQFSLNELVRDGDGRGAERHEITPEASFDSQRRMELALVLKEIRQALPSELHRQVMDALGRGGTTNWIAGELGISRRKVDRCIAELRRIFEDASLQMFL